jgi:hypothetical protein
MSSEVDELAMRALSSVLGKAEEAEKAYARGVLDGRKLALETLQERASSDVWDRVLGTVERIADKVLASPSSRAFARAATATAPTAEEADAERWAPVLQRLQAMPEVEGFARELRAQKLDAKTFDDARTVLAQVPAWAAWLDAQAEYVAALRAALDGDELAQPAPAPTATAA